MEINSAPNSLQSTYIRNILKLILVLNIFWIAYCNHFFIWDRYILSHWGGQVDIYLDMLTIILGIVLLLQCIIITNIFFRKHYYQHQSEIHVVFYSNIWKKEKKIVTFLQKTLEKTFLYNLWKYCYKKFWK